MLASELIKKLQKLIEEHGDKLVQRAEYEAGPSDIDEVVFEAERAFYAEHFLIS